jgi:hypothetical protein
MTGRLKHVPKFLRREEPAGLTEAARRQADAVLAKLAREGVTWTIVGGASVEFRLTRLRSRDAQLLLERQADQLEQRILELASEG